MDESLAVATGLGDRARAALAQTGLGNIACAGAAIWPARPFFAASPALARPATGAYVLATTLYNLAGPLTEDDSTQARALYAESLALRRRLGDRLGVGSTLDALGEGAREAGEYARAEALFAGSGALFAELGQRRGQASGLYTRGRMRLQQGDPGGAVPLLEAALALFGQVGSPGGVRAVHRDRAHAQKQAGVALQGPGRAAGEGRESQESLALT